MKPEGGSKDGIQYTADPILVKVVADNTAQNAEQNPYIKVDVEVNGTNIPGIEAVYEIGDFINTVEESDEFDEAASWP